MGQALRFWDSSFSFFRPFVFIVNFLKGTYNVGVNKREGKYGDNYIFIRLEP
jgi:hypothetical protein